MAGKICWGILATGTIARKFAEAVRIVPDAELVAVGSRSAETAEKFGEQFNIPRRYASYEALANDPDVDVIYVATPHNFHMENTILCLEAGKAVLCEKPFAVNAGQVLRMIDVAGEKKLFLMEAMWTRFLPVIAQVRWWLGEGQIGEVWYLQADFGFRGEWNPEGRHLNPELAGGALLDVGVYTVALASMVFERPPVKIASAAHLGQTGVDEQSAMVFSYEAGELAVLFSAVRTKTPQEAVIVGTKGTIKIHSPFWCATTAAISIKEKKDETVEMPHKGNGFEYQIEEVMQCLRTGRLESDIMGLEESLEIAGTMDEIRAQWGLKYPVE